MPKFRVTGFVAGSKYLGVFEADTKEEAEEMALDERGGPFTLCHQCSRECDDVEVESARAEQVDDDAEDDYEER